MGLDHDKSQVTADYILSYVLIFAMITFRKTKMFVGRNADFQDGERFVFRKCTNV